MKQGWEKGLARALIPRWTIEGARRFVERLDPFLRLSYSQDGEDMILRRLFEGQSSGFYVDVGAHHPRRFSNTYYFHRLGWNGISIDPDPRTIDAFKRDRPNDTNICVGVAETPGSMRLFLFDESALNTFDAALAEKRAEMSAYRLIESREVPVRRLDDILAEHLLGEQHIDFLSVDAEGFDLSVLRSNCWQRFRPHVLLVEARGVLVDEVFDDPIHKFATSVGYRMIAKTMNTLIYVAAGELR